MAMTEFTQYPSLAGLTVFVTGAATGIGACLVEEFHRQGARVGLVDHNKLAGDALVKRLGETSLYFIACDVTDSSAYQEAMHAIQMRLGPVTIVINNIANDQRHALRSMSLSQWRESMAVNLEPAFLASTTFAEGMARQGGGVIINISSINAYIAPLDLCSYNTAKAAMLGLTRSLANELGKDNIRANAVLPGWVATERQMQQWLTPEREAQWLQQLSLKRKIVPRDVANLVLFLASADAACITGQEFVIDCGRT